MSGLAATRSRDADLSRVACRGADGRRTVELADFLFTHFDTMPGAPGDEAGNFPYVEDEIVCLLDGMILPSPADPGSALVTLYRQHGRDFAQHLDGDFAVALYDFGNRRAFLVTDAFATKPLFRRNGEVASYASALRGGERVPPNTRVEIDLADGSETTEILKPFDFTHQTKTSYDDWVAAFERAVAHRVTADIYLPLSAGYDSGAIDCALSWLGADYKSYSVEGVENLGLLRERNPDGEIFSMSLEDLAEREAHLRTHTEKALYRARIDGELHTCDMLEDRATRALAAIHSRAFAEGRRVFLSGQGPDELMVADRAWADNRFPERLEPWFDFDRGFQEAYLTKEEYVGGTFGVEGRYPLLDRAVVQEFLWLSPELKNLHYKAPLHEYMLRRDYPFDAGIKTGFCPSPDGGGPWPWEPETEPEVLRCR